MTKPTALDVSVDGKIAFVGSESGAFRVYDISSRSLPRLVKQMRFFEKPTRIDNLVRSEDGKVVMISSAEAEYVFIVSAEPTNEFDIYGYMKM